MNYKKNVLVLGANGMLGNAVFRFFAGKPDFTVYGSVRSTDSLRFFPEALRPFLFPKVDVLYQDDLAALLDFTRPSTIINCIGLIKQLPEATQPLAALRINSLLPHQLATLSSLIGARLVHVSTDCVFAGTRGGYVEADAPDALDLYGRSKLLGEVDYPNAITLRTSIIGHELASTHGLVAWFLAQENTVFGFRKAVFSGLPTVELARVIRDYVLPNPKMHGLYHVSATPIAKLDLLKLVASTYGKLIDIQPNDDLVIDRSLNSSRFAAETGYSPPSWPELVEAMHRFG
jgi:dTDP-4-dehydrorhamnose reductase